MSDLEYELFCIELAEIAETDGVSTAIAEAMDNGFNYDEIIANLEYKGVIA